MFIIKCNNCNRESVIEIDNKQNLRISYGIRVVALDGSLLFECEECGCKIDDYNKDHRCRK
ncbi:MAG TPA: hypothetical protein GX708_24675 [Gallicola sp.]|nr:hypothetical protein [Gallicola sp.]